MATLRKRADVTSPGAGPESPETYAIRLADVRKQFRRADGTVVEAVDGTSLTIAEGEFVVLLGPSGCGKTTLLRSIAGLERPDSGEVEIYGRVVSAPAKGVHVGPEQRGLSMIFQSYALWPHMSVAANVSYPLRVRRRRDRSRAEVTEQVRQVLDRLGIGALAGQYPHQISGGQQQRVALARALVSGSRLILFDEPMSNVDAKVREQVRFELKAMHKEFGFAAVYVTHDQGEAMQLADRIAIINAGQIVQIGAPRELYQRPGNLFVARFVGTSNELPGSVRGLDGGTAVLDTDVGQLRGTAVGALTEGQRAVGVWRPERCQVHLTPPPGVSAWPGRLMHRSFVGAYAEIAVDIRGHLVRRWGADDEIADGADVWVSVDPQDMQVFPADD